MSETVVVTTEPEPEVTEPVVVEQPSVDNVATVAAEVAESVAEAVAEGVAAVEASEAVETTITDSRFAEVDSRLDGITARLDALLVSQSPEPEAEPETEVIIDDDEIVPDRRHPWFRPMHEWKGIDR